MRSPLPGGPAGVLGLDAACRVEAKVPPSVAFATKPALATSMLAAALAAQVPFSFMAADSGYGRDPHLRAFLHQQAVRYVVGVPVDLPIAGVAGKPEPGAPKAARAGDLLHCATSRDRWERRSCGEGAKGQRYYDWTVVDVTVTVTGQAPADGFAHRLLVRRSTEKGVEAVGERLGRGVPAPGSARRDGAVGVGVGRPAPAGRALGIPARRSAGIRPIVRRGFRPAVRRGFRTGVTVPGCDEVQFPQNSGTAPSGRGRGSGPTVLGAAVVQSLGIDIGSITALFRPRPVVRRRMPL
ncbi:transposase [Kitasatospora sp. NPDC056181]|uniref:transposase n=1 Tax=Kitasatospora sp. NPDC056181 TaxID=3345737 RepID=UPI0035E37409